MPLHFKLYRLTPLLDFLRAADVPTRQRYVALVEQVKEGAGTVKIFSSLHISGERKCACVCVYKGRERLSAALISKVLVFF